MVQGSVERLSQVVKERYVIEREVGRGGMATVYLARDLRDDRLVAIKVLLPDLGLAVGPDRFRREIDLASRFSHPNILPLYDSGEADGLLYYVMPYVEGESVRARLDREGPLPIDNAVAIAIEVAVALDYACDKGVVHRDIKPENILLDEGHALVADFGIARAVASATDEKLTQTGVALGTPRYMSPEQATGERQIDGRSDIYSLGCVLYEMLAGQPPFGGTSAQAIIMRHALDQAPPISTVRSTVSPELEAVVMRSLAKVPADRFPNAAAFAAALRSPAVATAGWMIPARASSATPTPAPPPIPAPVSRAPSARQAAFIAVAAVALAVGGWAAWHRWHGPARGTLATGGLDPKRVAVLYFDDASPSHDLGYVANGLTNALISQLTNVRTLNVISSGGVAPYRAGGVAPDSIARALQVGTLVRGSVEHDGNRLRVAVRLVDGNSGVDYERASFEQPAGKVLALRDTLAAQVSRMIRSRLGEEIKLQEQREGTSNANAWALLQRGQQRRRRAESLMTGTDTAAIFRDVRVADSLLASAQELEPNWADPAILRGQVAYKVSRFYRADPTRAAPWIDSALGHAEHALAIAPKSADALELRGTLEYWRWLLGLEPDAGKAKALFASAQQDLEAATRINPGQASAWAVLGSLYDNAGDTEGAKLAARRAYEEDAYLTNADVVVWRLFTSSYDLQQFVEAISWCDVLGRRFPSEPHAPECRLHTMETKAVAPDVPLAWRLADSLTTLSAEAARPFAALNGRLMVAAIIARAGLTDSARHVLSHVNAPPDVDPTRDLAESEGFAWILIGDKNQALRYLKMYLAANPSRAADLGSDPGWRWRSLQDDPRFQALVAHTASGR